MPLLQEFKTFAMRGNVIDLAVGVVIGAAFGKIVSTLVDSIIMPPLGWLTAGVDFKNLTINLPAYQGMPEVAIKYGQFIQACVDFTIIAFCIFMVLRLINRLAPKAPPPAPTGPTQEELLTQIRDLLKSQAKK